MLDRTLTEVTTVDLTVPFQILSMLCGLLAIYVMQQTWNDRTSQTDPKYFQRARRLAFIVLAVGLFWRVSFLDTHGAQPSPPEVLLVIGLTLVFFVRSALLHWAASHKTAVPPPLPRQRPRPF